MHRLLRLSACATLAATLEAAELRLPIALRAPAAGPVTAEVTLTPVQVPGAGPGETLRGKTELPGLFAIADLPAGAWMIEVQAPGYWHSPIVQTIGETRGALPELRLWPTATVTGNVTVPAGNDLPKEVTIRFQSSPSVADAERVPVTEIKCPVAEQQWTCALPAGRLDLRLRAASFQTQFVWDAEVKRGTVHDLGTAALRKGASLIGFVTTASKEPLDRTRVLLQPLSFGNADDERGRAAIRAIGVTANARGFFRIEGAAPGEYTVVAQLDKLRSPATSVRLVAEREVELLDPLALAQPKTLSLSITPPLAPDLRPWRVALAAESSIPGRTDLVAEEVADENGRWRRENVYGGRYRLTVKDGSGGRWLSKELDTAVEATDLALSVPMHAVHGTVTLGGEPLAALLRFGGKNGSVSISIRSNEEGRYRGFVPRDAQVFDRITIDSDLPRLSRTILNAKVGESDDGLRLDFALPSTHLRGEVIGPDGTRVDDALIRIQSDEHDWQSDVEAGADGRFEIAGQTPGWVTVQASAYLMESDPVRVQLRDDEPATVRLSLRPVDIVRGRIVAATGPVAGARVIVAPTDSSPLVVVPVTTNAKGEFAAMLQAGTREANVFVEAFGLATKMFHLTIPDSALQIPLDQLGGTLTVEVPQFHGSDATPKPYLFHAGADRLVHTVRGATFERTEGEGRVRIRVPMLERGMYAVCMATPADVPRLRAATQAEGRCVSGFMPPLGELALKLAP